MAVNLHISSIFICYSNCNETQGGDIMKFNFLVTTLLISSVITAGCSADSSESGEHEAMDHSNMTTWRVWTIRT